MGSSGGGLSAGMLRLPSEQHGRRKARVVADALKRENVDGSAVSTLAEIM
jgi:hypothetical protein